METEVKLTLPAFASVILLASCATVPRPSTYPVPPPLPAEVIPLPPVSETPLVWQPGDWVYTERSYRYDPGHYVPAAGHSKSWMFSRWVPGPYGKPMWVAGHWV